MQNNELETKLTRVREVMSANNLDAIFLKRQDSFAWLTCGGMNYVGLGEMGGCGLLITADKQYAITNNIEANRMKDEEHLEDMGFAIYDSVWHDVEFEDKKIAELTKNGKVGYDYSHGSDANVSNDVKQKRLSLTQEEIERYKVGGFLAAKAIEQALVCTHPGETELDVVARLAKNARESGLDVCSSMCAADHRIYNYRHPVPTENVIKERVQLGANLRYKGLITCCTRYINFVPIDEKLNNQYLANVKIDCTLMANSIPGNTYVSALEAGKKAYKEAGYADEFNKHHQGGAIGYAVRDYKVDFATKGTIHENQAFCWNPSITGTKSEGTVIVNSNEIIPASRPVFFPTVEITVGKHTFTRPRILELV